jgi:predicted secreted Zn-dependent protease
MLAQGGRADDPPPVVEATVGLDVAPTIAPSPVPAPTSAPSPQVVALPDRTSCGEIRGTAYRSEAERAFFLQSCVQAAPAASGSSPPVINTSANCSTDIRVVTWRRDATFDVSGLTVDEIEASLDANGPIVEGERAVGLTAYTYGFDGAFCDRAGSCTIGALSIRADVVVTLPRLTTLSQLDPQLRDLWQRFYDRVRVHEERHVTILEDALAESRRQLLLIGAQPNCDTLEHEIDKVWVLNSTQMELRQESFHIADRSGQGGIVVR